MYSMTKCDNLGIKAVYNYKNRILLLQGPKNVTSEITSSGFLTSYKSFVQQGSFFII